MRNTVAQYKKDYQVGKSNLTLAVLLSEEAISEDVNSNPAMYTVIMNKNASEDEKLKEDFINLARSLPTDTDFSSTDNLQ